MSQLRHVGVGSTRHLSQLRHAARRGLEIADNLLDVTRWILTREGSDADALDVLLRARGQQALRVPCIETRWHGWPWEPDARALTFFTSRRAVEAFARQPIVRPGSIASLRPETSRALAKLGLEPDIEAAGGSKALADAVVAAWPTFTPKPSCIRYPTSGAGIASSEQEEAMRILSQLANVERGIVYDVAPPASLADSLAAALRDAWSVVFASPSAVSHFLAATPADPHAPSHAICFGASTARAWNAQRPPRWPAAWATTDVRNTILEVIP